MLERHGIEEFGVDFIRGQMMKGTNWRHKKTGNLYVVICVAVVEKTHETVVVYRQVHTIIERIWTRPMGEFLDGRFEKVA